VYCRSEGIPAMIFPVRKTGRNFTGDGAKPQTRRPGKPTIKEDKK